MPQRNKKFQGHARYQTQSLSFLLSAFESDNLQKMMKKFLSYKWWKPVCHFYHENAPNLKHLFIFPAFGVALNSVAPKVACTF